MEVGAQKQGAPRTDDGWKCGARARQNHSPLSVPVETTGGGHAGPDPPHTPNAPGSATPSPEFRACAHDRGMGLPELPALPLISCALDVGTFHYPGHTSLESVGRRRARETKSGWRNVSPGGQRGTSRGLCLACGPPGFHTSGAPQPGTRQAPTSPPKEQTRFFVFLGTARAPIWLFNPQILVYGSHLPVILHPADPWGTPQ